MRLIKFTDAAWAVDEADLARPDVLLPPTRTEQVPHPTTDVGAALVEVG